jgi:hypothetical protein
MGGHQKKESGRAQTLDVAVRLFRISVFYPVYVTDRVDRQYRFWRPGKFENRIQRIFDDPYRVDHPFAGSGDHYPDIRLSETI